jgi:AcrR family transcriptional regulator
MASKSARREKSLESINAAALDLFVTKGYKETTVDEIAAQAGLSKGSIYHYFNSKQELALDLLKSFHSELDQLEWGIVRDAECTRDKIRMGIRLFFEWVKESPKAALYFFGPEGGKVFEGEREPPWSFGPLQALEQLFVRGQAAGEVKETPPWLLTLSFRIPVQLALNHALGRIECDILEYVDEVAEMVWGAVRSDSAARDELLEKVDAAEQEGG